MHPILKQYIYKKLWTASKFCCTLPLKRLETAYHPDFGREVQYEFRALPEAADGQVRSTIHDIMGFIRQDAQSPFIQAEARRMLELGDGNPNLGLWKMLKPAMRFKQDEDIAGDLAVDDDRKKDTIEVLIRPIDQWMLIKLRGIGIGDCDCYSMYGACLLTALGIPSVLCTVSAHKDRPHEFSHVYLVSYWNGIRFPLDISHGEYPGWECPNLGRLKEWRVMPTPMECVLDMALPVGLLVGIYFSLKWAYR